MVADWLGLSSVPQPVWLAAFSPYRHIAVRSAAHRLLDALPAPSTGANAKSRSCDCADAQNRKAWLFHGSELAGQRAAMVMSLINLNGHDPWAYHKDVPTRMPTHLNSRIEELLSHRRQPQD